ncbi:pimeloyl-ACP methyl ester carboxylesterase [Propionicimonas paludicola]|uniref:Pimeloyl-ACP methyl ester carboxylesterase n=1 Tax=Propionicimonas paludicola TaxID=185243 RepID=A0A2A9CVJ3_9ACTN|nr:alpha/beta fold hydrolase [Propionicimonas paludicola]PFG18428.1 pimeloyl-ACP methyl ester carboxylesterase [Propionicimonas paludicola]
MTGRRLPVVLLHSAGQTPQMWQPQVEAIGADVRVIAPWLAGLRPGKPGDISLVSTAADVISQLDRYGIEKAWLVGHQLGAMTALQVATTEPSMVAGLVLSGAMLTPGRLALGMQKTLIRMLPNQALADSGATKADLLRALDVIAGADFGAKIGTVEVPALVFAGASDPSRAAGKQLADALPQGLYVELDGAGAMPSLEAADQYNQLLVDFLGLR